MKHLLLLCLFSPFIAFSQLHSFYSAEGRVGIGKGLDNTAYGATLSGNVGASENLFMGLSAGVLRIAPFLSKASSPLSLRGTYFLFSDKDRTVPFAIFEGGKLLHHEEARSGSMRSVTNGGYHFFAGMGVRLPSSGSLHGSFAAGFSQLAYTANQYGANSETALDKQAFKLKRLTVSVGLQYFK